MIKPKTQTPVHETGNKSTESHAGRTKIVSPPLRPEFPAIPAGGNMQQKADEKIRQSEEKRRLIMNAALDAIVCTDTKGVITFWNPKAEVIFGWTECEAMGQPLSQLIIPEQYRSRHEQGMANYLRTGVGPALNKILELSAINKDDNEFPIELTIMPIKQVGEEFFCAFIRDITEKKSAEKKLKQSEARLIEAQAMAKVGSWETDLLTLKVIWSEETYRIFEIDPAMFKTSHPGFLEFVHPDDKAKVDAAFVRSVNDRSVNTIEHRILTPRGKIKIVEERWRIVCNNNGQPIRAVGTCQDITEHRQSEIALKKAYEEKNMVLESIDDGFFATDNDSIVTYWNKRAEILLNTKREDIIGRNLHEVYANPASMAFYNNYQKAINEKSTVHFEEFSPRTNKWFSVSAFASEIGLSVYFKDVTERKEYENKIKKSELRYRSLIEQATDTICITDATFKFIEMNPSGCRMFGYSKEEILQLYMFDILFEEDLKTNPIKFDELRAGKTTSNERRIKRKDGVAIDVELNAKMLEDGSIMVFGRDITERKQANLLLKESNERYNLVSKATNDMVWDWDLVTGKVYRNKEGWKKIFNGVEQEAELGSINDWNNRIHPEDEPKVKEVNDEIGQSLKDFFEVECRMRRDDGTYAYIHDRGNIIRNAAGKAIRLIGATQDITLRKEAELQVTKSEFRFRSLVQNSSDLVSILNERGYYLYCSPATKRVLGYDPEFIEGKNAFSFIHPDDVDGLKENLTKNKAIKFTGMPSFRFRNAQGEWRWLESKISDMRDNPEVQGYVFNSRDVTERKTAEEEIEKLSIIARKTVNVVIITNPEGEIIWVNDAFTHITEFEFEEVIGKKPGAFLQGEETNPDVVGFMRNELQKNNAFECDVINYSKSGRKYWIRIQAQPQFDETGKLKYFFAIQTDITKEKETAEILRASEERYRYLFNNNPASIIIWDINTLQILEVNNTAVAQHGYSREEFLSKTIMDQSPAEHHDKLKDFIERVRQKNDFKSVITSKYLNKSGEEIYLSIASHRIQYKGRSVIMALATNVTENVSLERILEEERVAKHQEITNAVISAQEQERQELGGELHDNIIQILAGSLLYLGLAKKELPNGHPYLKETEDLVSSAITEIRNLSHSLIPPSLHESELLGAINHIIETTQQTSGMLVSLMAFDFDESTIPDKLKLGIYRIIQEQFTNILKHAKAEKVIVQLVQDKEKLILSIKDDGIGFDTTLKANGVGLMNIKTRASLFNGELSLISSPGKGCELRVSFN